MLGLLSSLGNLLLGAVFPVARWPGVRAVRPGVRAVLHVVLVALVLAGLYALDCVTNFSVRMVGARFLAQHLWMPLFFLMVYGLAWVVWWVWSLLTAEPERAPVGPEADFSSNGHGSLEHAAAGRTS